MLQLQRWHVNIEYYELVRHRPRPQRPTQDPRWRRRKTSHRPTRPISRLLSLRRLPQGPRPISCPPPRQAKDRQISQTHQARPADLKYILPQNLAAGLRPPANPHNACPSACRFAMAQPPATLAIPRQLPQDANAHTAFEPLFAVFPSQQPPTPVKAGSMTRHFFR
jgi:hypothetical protein